MNWASIIVLWMMVFHSVLSFADTEIKVGDCASADDTSTFLRSQKQKPVAMMNRVNLRVDIPEAQKNKLTIGNNTATGWAWLLSYETTLQHFDAFAKKHSLEGEKRVKVLENITELRDLRLKQGAVKRTELGLSILLLTATTDLKQWYLLAGNQPIGQTPNQYCLLFSGSSLNVFNEQNLSEQALLSNQFDPLNAEIGCLDISGFGALTCTTRKAFEDELKAKDMGIAVNALATKGYNNNGEVHPQHFSNALMLSLAVNPKNQSFKMTATTGDGATFLLEYGQDFKYLISIK